MSALMSTHLVEIAEPEAARQESLAERLARCPLSLTEALRCATEIAAALRDLHQHGLAYGAVSSQLIEMGAPGAALRPTGGLKRLGDGRGDVTAFGAVLLEMLRREAKAGEPESLRGAVRALALRCQDESPDMRQVLIALRLLMLQARQCAAPARPVARPTVEPPTPVAVAPAASAGTRRVRVRIRMALHWKPLANLAIFASSGK
jgi:hypothetical protein